MILKKTVIVIQNRENANSPISEKTKDSNWISPDGRLFINAMNVKDVRSKEKCIKGNNCKTPMEKREKDSMYQKSDETKTGRKCKKDHQRIW